MLIAYAFVYPMSQSLWTPRWIDDLIGLPAAAVCCTACTAAVIFSRRTASGSQLALLKLAMWVSIALLLGMLASLLSSLPYIPTDFTHAR